MDKSAESPRGPKMEASVNEDTEEMAERNTLHGDGKYRAITEGDITRMNHERSGPSLKKKTGEYYKVNPEQGSKLSIFQSTSTGQFLEQMLRKLSIRIQIQVRIQWMSN